MPKKKTKKIPLSQKNKKHSKPSSSCHQKGRARSLSFKEDRLFENFSKVAYSFIKGKQYTPLSKETLIQRLCISPSNVPIFERALCSLEHDGKIIRKDDVYCQNVVDSFHLEPGEIIIQGSLSVHPRGFGFVEQKDDDIFIPKPLMLNALDGDIVEVAVNTLSVSEKGPEGRILRIIERKRSQLVGVVTSISESSLHLFSTMLGEHHDVHYEDHQKRVLRVGDRVVFNVSSWGEKGKPTIGSLAECIGHVTDAKSDLPYLLKSSDIPVEFPPEVIQEATRFGNKVLKKDLAGRTDLRDLECFTIDPDTAKDFDDALSLEQTPSGFRLGVHIADVSHYVKEGSFLDKEAHKRCNSTYFPNHCIPMLPKELSECLCSLKPHVNRLTVSVFFEIENDGIVKSWNIVRSVIKSKKRFTYKEVKAILDGKKKSPFAQKLHLMEKLCRLLQKQRQDRSSVQLFLPELIVKLNENEEPTGTETIAYDISHQLVEECMLKANEIVAFELAHRGKDLTYRVHEEPTPESLRDFASLVSAFGYQIPQDPSSYDIQRFFLEIENSRHAPFLSLCYIRSMRLACYSADNIGHYGLGLEHYCHFTSPIRRYVDTIIHRLLFEKGPSRQEIEEICEKASEKERASARAEGSLITIKKLRLLHEWYKKTPKKVYQAIITRVKPFGIFFDITDLMLEGFLHISELGDDYYLFDEATSHLTGKYEGFVYGCGEKILVSCRNVDLLLQETSWVLTKAHEERY